MNKYISLYSIFAVLLIISCEKTEKIDNFPRHQSKLVTNCFFRPDTFFQFSLSKSLSPIDNAPFKPLGSPNARIRIFENNIFFDSLTIKPGGNPVYLGSRRPTPNNTYRFECTYPGFGLVKAEDRLPEAVSIQKMKGFYTVITSYSSNDTILNGDFSTSLNLDFDKTGQYLMLKITANALYRYPGYIYGGYYYEDDIYNVSDLNSSNESEYVYNSLFISNPAGVKNLNLKWDNNYGYMYKNKPSFKYQISIYSCSKDAYEYLKRQALQIENNDDPFSQPTPISNNIVNGYGIFGGINIVNDSLSF